MGVSFVNRSCDKKVFKRVLKAVLQALLVTQSSFKLSLYTENRVAAEKNIYT